MCPVGVVVRRYIHFLILLIPTPLVSAIFFSSIPTFCLFFNVFRSVYIVSPPPSRGGDLKLESGVNASL